MGPRIVQHVHASPGRVRLRLPWLRHARDAAVELAEHLVALDETLRVEVRPWTGSVLCTFEPDRLEPDQVLAAVRRHTRTAAVERLGGDSQRAVPPPPAGVGSISRAMAESVRNLNEEVLEASEGRLDLGAVAGLGFLGLGAAEIASTRAVPAPPWFNLAWWAFRTFTLFGRESGEETNGGAAPPDRGPAPLGIGDAEARG